MTERKRKREESGMIPNTNYNNLKDSYLFYHIAQKTGAYLEEDVYKRQGLQGSG